MNKLKMGLATLALVGFASLGIALPAQATGNHDECVPSEAYSEVVTPGTPAVDAVYETVVVTEAGWQRYSLNGSWDQDVAPAFPGDNWQANVAGDPHEVGVAGAYFRSNGNSGNVDWFYLEAIAEVTEQVLVTPAVPAVDPVIIEHEAVICDEEPTPILPTCTAVTDSVTLVGEEYVGNVLTLTTTEAEQGYWQVPFVGNLADIGTQLEVIADPASEVGLWIYVDGKWIVYEEGQYSGNLWSKTAFEGIPAGSGYAASAPIEDYIALYGDLPAEAWLLYGTSEAGSTAVSSVTVGCTTYTFAEPVVIVIPDAPEAESDAKFEDTTDCEARTVSTQEFERHTLEPIYNEESNTWTQGDWTDWAAAGDPVVRDATEEECPTPPVVTPPDDEKPVVVDTTSDRDELQYTGVTDLTWMIGTAAAFLTIIGSVILALRRKFA